MTARKIRWYGDASHLNDPKEIRKRHAFACRSSLLRKIDSISDREYEALAIVTAECLGADNVQLTTAGNDFGVDFYATMTYRSDAHIFHGHGGRLRIVGQSKKFGRRVEEGVIKELAITMQAISHQSPKVFDTVPAWFYDAPGPIVGWVAGHSGFQSGTASLAKNFGILLSDSIDYAEMLASSRLARCGRASCGQELQDRLDEVIARF